MQHGLLPATAPDRRNLVDHAAAAFSIASVGRGSVKIASAVEDQRAAGARSVLAAGEVVHHSLDPVLARFREQEDDSTAIPGARPARSAGDGGAIKIALAVQRDSAVGVLAVVAAGEAVQHSFLPLATGNRRQFEHGSAAVRA